MPWTIEFFEDDSGRQPAREWLRSLDPDKRAAVIAAVEVFLGEFGLDICRTEHGKQLGQGLFELRIRHEEAVTRGKAPDGQAASPSSAHGRQVLLRVFCHAYGKKVVLLLGGYDKGADTSARRQDREIEIARNRLRAFKLRQQRLKAGARRRR